MTFDNDSYLSFSLEESIWFRKGQEVDHLLSISLEPDVTIDETDNYATIRGSLYLSGEYKKAVDAEEALTHFPAQAFIHSVLERDELRCEFSHRFPIDITIPLNRINDIYDVHVVINEFDYEITNGKNLLITADLLINGLRKQNDETTQRTDDVEGGATSETDKITLPKRNDDIDDSYGENRQQEQIESTGSTIDDEVPHDKRELSASSVEQLDAFADSEELTYDISPEEQQPFIVEVRKEPSSEIESPNEIPTLDVTQQIISSSQLSSLKDEFEQTGEDEDRPEVDTTDHLKSSHTDDILNERKDDDKPKLTTQANSEETELVDEITEVDRSEEDASSEQGDYHNEEDSIKIIDHVHVNDEVEGGEKTEEKLKDEKKTTKKTLKEKLTKTETLTLTEFFSRKEETEQAKLKLCIVQPGETVANLAEKYEVNEQRILRINKLDITDEISEGQVLYIPMAEE